MMRRVPLLAVLLLAFAFGAVTPVRPASAESTAPPKDCGNRVRLVDPERGRDGSLPQQRPHADGHYTPILLVHGWRGKPSMWSQPINLSTLKIEPSSNHSLLGNLQKLAGAAVYTLDYGDVAEKWFLDRHAGADRFIAAEDCLTAAAAFSGHRLIVVAHSMGGLITRWSLSDAAPDGAARRDRIGIVLTLGTPYEGSVMAAAAVLLADTAVRVGAALDKRFAAVVGVIHQLVALCHDVRGFGPCDELNALVNALAAVRAFAPDSREMRSLAGWPAGTNVETLASRTIVETGGLFFLKGFDVDVGDVVVPVESATSGAYSERVAQCRLTDSPTAALWDGLMVAAGQKADLDARTYWLLALLGTCFHSNEARLIQHTNEILGAIADELAREGGGSSPGAATAVVDLTPVDSHGRPVAGWSVDDRTSSGSDLDCSFNEASPAARTGDIYYCSPNAELADACWVSANPAHVLCLRDPSKQVLVELAAHRPPTGPARHTEAVWPLRLDLDDGDVCRLRNGGSWGVPQTQPDYVGWYRCTKAQAVWGPRGKGIDMSGATWTVITGGETGPLTTRAVVKAYYVGTAP